MAVRCRVRASAAVDPASNSDHERAAGLPAQRTTGDSQSLTAWRAFSTSRGRERQARQEETLQPAVQCSQETRNAVRATHDAVRGIGDVASAAASGASVVPAPPSRESQESVLRDATNGAPAAWLASSVRSAWCPRQFRHREDDAVDVFLSRAPPWRQADGPMRIRTKSPTRLGRTV